MCRSSSAGSLLLSSRASWSLDLPVNPTNVALTAEGRQRVRRHWEQLERLKRLAVEPARP